jgi:xylan 1,4-beta-xylosidase
MLLPVTSPRLRTHRNAVFAWGCVALLAAPPLANADHLRRVTLDATADQGLLRPLQGVNGAPEKGRSKPFGYGGMTPRNPAIDVSAGYRAAHITLIRTHDSYGAGDIDAHFFPPTVNDPIAPHVPATFDADDIFPNRAANPEDPASYHWGPTDALIASILAVGAEPLFRIGRSEGSDATTPDPQLYAEIVRHVVLHYNKGWDHGLHAHIRYWEVWNEPDLANFFWAGSPAQFFALYDALAHAIKAADSTALVGGPPLSRPLNVTPYRDAFLDHLKAQHVPLDFMPFHWYAMSDSDPYLFANVATTLHGVLRDHGWPNTPLLLTEWNGQFLFGNRPDPAFEAAFIETSLIAMQDSPIAAQTLYRADDMFGADGNTPDMRGQALIMHGWMQATPHRLAVTGGDRDGFALLAGRSDDGKTIQLLLANYEIPQGDRTPRAGGDSLNIAGIASMTMPPRRDVTYHDNRGYDLHLTHLKADQRYRVERYRLSHAHPLALVDSQTVPGDQIHLSATLPPPAIEFVRITRMP